MESIGQVNEDPYHGVNFRQAQKQWAQTGVYAQLQLILMICTHHAFILTARIPLLLVGHLLNRISE